MTFSKLNECGPKVGKGVKCTDSQAFFNTTHSEFHHLSYIYFLILTPMFHKYDILKYKK
jgi:hypothetical protein